MELTRTPVQRGCQSDAGSLDFIALTLELVEGYRLGKDTFMTDSYALLADATRSGRRTAVLKTEDEAYSIRASVMHSEDRQLLLVRAWLADMYVYVLLDERAGILATATGERHEDTYERIRDEVARRKHYPLRARDDEYGLLADHVEGSRRTSVLKSDDDAWSMRVKLIKTDEDTLIQARIWVGGEVGYAHLVLDADGAI